MNTWAIFRLYMAGLATFVWYRFLRILSWPGQALSWLISWLNFFMVWIIPSRLKAAWRWVITHKVQILMTILFFATIVGGAASVYLWRHEIATCLTIEARRVLALVRGFFWARHTVIVASYPKGKTEPAIPVIE